MPELLQAVHRHVEEMAEALAQLEPHSAFWSSLRESGMSLEVLGERFNFTVDTDKLVLTEADPVPAQVV